MRISDWSSDVSSADLVGKSAHLPTILRFGLPAIPAAIAGAVVLGWLGQTEAAFTWQAGGRSFAPSGAGPAIGVSMILFALLEQIGRASCRERVCQYV